MTPGGRLSAAIEALDQIIAGQPAERVLTRWARASRFAGSKDRAAVRDIVFDVLRRRRSALWSSGQPAETGRALVTGLLAQTDPALLDAFDGESHAPEPLSDAERAALRPDLSDAPPAVAFDYPDVLRDEVIASFGRADAPQMAALRDRAPVDLRVNRLKASVQTALVSLAREGIGAEPVEGLPDALRVAQNPRRIAGSQAYRTGLVELQDAASQYVALRAGARPGMRVLDLCAGGGGKTLALAAAMGGEGLLCAYDADPGRMTDLPERAARAGARVHVLEDAALEKAAGRFDLVMVDAPCSGSGAWRRNPDAKWRMTPERLAGQVALQATILDRAAGLVAPGGRVLYATCSIFVTENARQTEAFLARHPDFEALESEQLQPENIGDGFYYCLMARN